MSPNGNQLIFTALPADGPVVMAPTYPGEGPTQRVSTGNGAWPQWNSTGDRLYYVEGFDLMEIDVTYRPSARFSRPKKLFKLEEQMVDRGPAPGNPYFAIVGDGERYIVTQLTNETTREKRGIVVVQNWVIEFAESP